jgi:hypothetical protein
MDEVFENAAARQDPDYLSGSSVPSDIESQPESPVGKTKTLEDAPGATSRAEGSADQPEGISKIPTYATANEAQKPTLALTPDQFSMIKSLNRVGFRKYPVYIHKHRHTHAAIVVRMDKEGFEEGHTVIKHWLDNEFEL